MKLDTNWINATIAASVDAEEHLPAGGMTHRPRDTRTVVKTMSRNIVSGQSAIETGFKPEAVPVSA